MRGGGGFELRLDGKSTAIELNVRSLRDRCNFARRREPAELVELDAERIGRPRFRQRVSILEREERLVRHHRHAVRGAADFRHAREVAARHRLLDVTETQLLELMAGGRTSGTSRRCARPWATTS